jgi:hypothetical protein
MAQGLIKPERLQIILSPEELEGVDDFRFKKRTPSRASAIRELLKRGLATEGFEAAAAGRKSRSFGVLGPMLMIRRRAAVSGAPTAS